MSFPHRGEIYWVALDPTIGTEIAKTRPGVVISNNVGNEYSDRVTIAPTTTRNIDRVYPFEVLLTIGETGLTLDSKVALDQIRAVDKRRLGRRIGEVPPERMLAVDAAIRISLEV